MSVRKARTGRSKDGSYAYDFMERDLNSPESLAELPILDSWCVSNMFHMMNTKL